MHIIHNPPNLSTWKLDFQVVYTPHMRSPIFNTGDFYHIYNRGNNKRSTYLDFYDFQRFLESVDQFNTENTIGSIYENSFRKRPLGSPTSKLVNIVCFCLNPNHYHLLLEQLVENGISKFMHRLGTGYTKYFNQKYSSSGSLFQGKYKFIRVGTNEYLLHLSSYINLNFKVHGLGGPTSKSSWDEYINPKKHFELCTKEIILSQFKNRDGYKKFAYESLATIKEKRDLEELLLE